MGKQRKGNISLVSLLDRPTEGECFQALKQKTSTEAHTDRCWGFVEDNKSSSSIPVTERFEELRSVGAEGWKEDHYDVPAWFIGMRSHMFEFTSLGNASFVSSVN